MWTMLKDFIKFVPILLLFYVPVFWPRGVCDLSFPSKGQTYTLCIGRWSLNYWTSKEVPMQSFHTVLIILVVQLLSHVLMDCSMPNSSVLHCLPEFAQIHVHWVSDAILPSHHLILRHPLLLWPSIFPSIRVFPNGLVLCIRWPKYCLSFSNSPSNEYSGFDYL